MLSILNDNLAMGQKSWQDKTVRNIRRAGVLMQETQAGGPGPASLLRCISAQCNDVQNSDVMCTCETPRPHTSGSGLSSGAQMMSILHHKLREQYASASIAVAIDYMRRVREVEGRLRGQSCLVTQEGVKLEKERDNLERMSRDISSTLAINKRSSEVRTKRPSHAETGKDGADEMLSFERNELTQVKQDLEDVLEITVIQQQALGQSSKQLLDCARERALVLELLPHVGSAGKESSNVCTETFTKTDPIGPFTPECKEALEISVLSVKQSKILRENIRKLLINTVSRQKAVYQTVNNGLEKKKRETVGLEQNLILTSAAMRQAMFSKQREIKCMSQSHNILQGPEYSTDLQTTEKLNRPLLRIYHRHPGTQLPEAIHLIQGTAGLKKGLMLSKNHLSKLKNSSVQLQDDQQGKRAAAQVDDAVVRMRRRQVNKRAMPAIIQQAACRGPQ